MTDFLMTRRGGRPRRLTVLCACLGLAIPVSAGTEAVYSSAGRKNPLANLGGTARAAAMGSAFSGVSDDASSVLWNPAGLAGLERPEVSIHHGSLLGGAFQEALVLGMPLKGRRGGIGLAGDFAGYGAFDGRDITGLPLGDYNVGQVGLRAGWGRPVAGGLSAGMVFHGTQQSFAGAHYALLGADLGLLLRAGPSWRFGASYANLGLGKESGTMASSLRLGVSRGWRDRNGTVLAALGGDMRPRIGGSLQAGLEVGYHSTVFLRGGYSHQLQETGYDGVNGLTAGAGFALKSFRLDYAFLPFGDLGNTHRVSLGYKLGPEPQPAGAAAAKAASSIPVTHVILREVPSLPAFSPDSLPGAQVVPKPLAEDSGEEKGQTLTMEFDEAAQGPLGRGRELAGKGLWAESAQAFREAIAREPKNPLAWHGLGTAYYRLGQKKYAIQCFENVLKLKPGDRALAEWLEAYRAAPDPAAAR